MILSPGIIICNEIKKNLQYTANFQVIKDKLCNITRNVCLNIASRKRNKASLTSMSSSTSWTSPGTSDKALKIWAELSSPQISFSLKRRATIENRRAARFKSSDQKHDFQVWIEGHNNNFLGQVLVYHGKYVWRQPNPIVRLWFLMNPFVS